MIQCNRSLAILALSLSALAVTRPALAGRLLATGHDADLHCRFAQQCHFFEIAVDYVRGGAPDPSRPVLVLDRLDLDVVEALDNAFGAGVVPRVVMDPRSATFASAPINVGLYSALIIASDVTCGGCDLNEFNSTPDSDAINARAADIQSFFNAGGGIFAIAGANHGDGAAPDDVYYDFIPIPVGGLPVLPPFTLTAAGQALGFEDSSTGIGTNDDINCCPTHNSFVNPSAGSVIQVAELDTSGQAETIFAEGIIDDGEIVAQCTGKTPAYDDPVYASTFTGQVAVATCFAAQSSDPVLVVIDLKNQASAPLDTSWDATSSPPTAFYHAASWTKANLGNVFGLTLDNGGNIYLTATSSFSGDTFGPAGAGGIYRIDASSGAVTAFATLANTGASLGNIHYDATYDSFYVTNLDDGLIVRLDHPPGNGTATVLGQWDHGANLPSSTPPSAAIPDDPAQPFTPLGRRVWGVHSVSGRLYYSVWWEHQGAPDPAHANEIWSVALEAAGGFVVGTARLEVSLPPLPGGTYSNPVSDINFGPAGKMLLAERSMGDLTTPSAHLSRGLEYFLSAGAWMPSPIVFEVSQAFPPGSTAGGVDQDFASGGRIWFSGDALHLGSPDNIYGLQGLPASGGDTTNSILIDLNGDVAEQNKTEIGDVAISCPIGSTPSEDLDVSLFTGWDESSHVRLTRGAIDDDWTVTVAGSKTHATLVSQPPAAWSRFGRTEWISASASGASQAGASTVRFERCFCLAPDATNAKLMLRLWADDQATVLLNNVPIAGPGGQFRRVQPLSVLHMGTVGSSLFQPGTNCVAIDVEDTRQQFVGLDADGRVWVDHGKCAGVTY